MDELFTVEVAIKDDYGTIYQRIKNVCKIVDGDRYLAIKTVNGDQSWYSHKAVSYMEAKVQDGIKDDEEDDE